MCILTIVFTASFLTKSSFFLLLEMPRFFVLQYHLRGRFAARPAATKIARKLNLSENEVFHISLAALLHDIGKIRVPLSILNKPKGLTDEEYKLIQSHPVNACDILDGLIDLDDICQMVRHHHERVDGTGYPDGIAGE